MSERIHKSRAVLSVLGRLGFLWLALTLTFEFLFGRFVCCGLVGTPGRRLQRAEGWAAAVRDAGPPDVAADCLEGTGIDTMNWMDWYNSLVKPDWTPAPATIGLIWQILSPIILVTFGFVFVQTIRRKIPWTVALPFATNRYPLKMLSPTA